MFKRKPKYQPQRGVEYHDVRAIQRAVNELTRATVQQRLELAAIRRVMEHATGYEHPTHARLRRLDEARAEAEGLGVLMTEMQAAIERMERSAPARTGQAVGEAINTAANRKRGND